MSESKHTRGPWIVMYGGLDGDTSFTIASKLDPGVVCEYGVPTPRPSEEVIANANLIAASPDMYSALLGCKWILETLVKLNRIPANSESLRDTLAALDLATKSRS